MQCLTLPTHFLFSLSLSLRLQKVKVCAVSINVQDRELINLSLRVYGEIFVCVNVVGTLMRMNVYYNFI
jgi:hypothetical protein